MGTFKKGRKVLGIFAAIRENISLKMLLEERSIMKK